MPIVQTEILKPGRYCLGVTEQGEKVYAHFDRQRLEQIAADGNEMIARAISIPICWDHSDNAVPVTMGRNSPARSTIGYASRFEVRADGSLWGDWNVPDARDAKQAEKVKFVSPDINYFTDETGRDWGHDTGGVLLHLAVTNKPVRSNQTPIAVRMSRHLATPLPVGVRLSREQYEGDPMDEELDDTESGENNAGIAEQQTPDPAMTPVETPLATDPRLTAVLGILAKFGLVVPKDTTAENLFDRIIAADMVLEAARQKIEQSSVVGNVDDEDLTGRPDIQVGQPNSQGGVFGGISMSRKPTPLEEKMAAQLFENKRVELRQRLDRLSKSGLFDKAAIDKQIAAIPGIRMSITADAKVSTTEIEQWIAAREEVAAEHKKKNGGARLSRGQLVVVDPPASLKADEARGNKADEIKKLASETAKKLSVVK